MNYHKHKGCLILNYDKKSFFSFNPVTNVAIVFYNARTSAPINTMQSSKYIKRALKKQFSVKESICVADPSQKSSRGTYYVSGVEFYFKQAKCPDIETVLSIPEIIQNNIVLQEFLKTDIETGETEILNFFELPKGQVRYNIIKYCLNPLQIDKKGKRKFIQKAYWSFI